MKVLCVCNSGNVRSVTLGRQLKKRGAEVLCCGVDKAFKNSTIKMLANWADVIYCQKDAHGGLVGHLMVGLTPEILDSNPEVKLHFENTCRKIDTRFDVGPDDWKIPDHPDLHRRVRDMLMADPEWSEQNSDNA